MLIDDLPLLDAPAPVKDALGPVTAPTQEAHGRTVYIESYGCQMNFSDSEIILSIMGTQGYGRSHDPEQADLVLLNTCAIRENAEQKIRHRLVHLNALKRRRPGMVIGVMGCMAERLKAKLIEQEKMVDLVVGPDAYRALPELVEEALGGQKGVNVFLSREETYGDIEPVRLDENGVSAFVSIMRGCDNMCSFCVVPYTRGRERSRDVASIEQEVRTLYHRGYREVTLLGQNVDSYKFTDEAGERTDFAALLERVARVSPEVRVRFSTSHPKDMTDRVLEVMAAYDNICKYLHLPAQSGSSSVLDRMNRTYDREWYLERIAAIKRILGPMAAISTDIIAGFCGETDEDHADTLSLMEAVMYDYAYMFAYSERPGTPAARKLRDDVPEEVKKARLTEIINLQQTHSLARNQLLVGTRQRVLVEGPAKRGEGMIQGRIDRNNMTILPGDPALKGTYVDVVITGCTSATLLAEPA